MDGWTESRKGKQTTKKNIYLNSDCMLRLLPCWWCWDLSSHSSLASTSAILQLWLGLWRHGHRPAGWVRRHSLHRKTAVNTQLTITVQDTIFIFMINHFIFYSPPHHITAAGQLHSAPTTLPDDGTSRSAKYFHKYKYLWSREREVSVHVHTGVIAIVHGRGFT